MKEFERLFMKLYYTLQQQQYDNYFHNANYDLNIIDEQFYHLVNKYKNKIHNNNRLGHIANLLIDRNIVDKNAKVATLRNKLDDHSNYIQRIIGNNKYRFKLNVAMNMKDDVIKLIKLRNQLSQDLGYRTYKDLVFKTEEFDEATSKNLLTQFITENLHKAKKIIHKYDISFETYFEDLNRINIPIESSPHEVITSLVKKLGYEHVLNRIDVIYNEMGFGYAANTSPNQVKIVIKPINSISDLSTLFHELGHAFAYSLNEEQGLYKLIPATIDEAMAVVIEYLAPLFLLDTDKQEKMKEITTLEYTRCAISALYEFDLWDDCEQAEELYLKHYSQLFNIKDPGLWSYDSFRSIDPVYIHSYVLGAIIQKNLINTLQNIDKPHLYGKWLSENIYQQGRKNNIMKFIL